MKIEQTFLDRDESGFLRPTLEKIFKPFFTSLSTLSEKENRVIFFFSEHIPYKVRFELKLWSHSLPKDFLLLMLRLVTLEVIMKIMRFSFKD